MITRLTKTLLAIAIVALSASPPAFAATSTGSMNVTAQVMAGCSAVDVSAPTMNFGSITQNLTAYQANAVISFTCTNTTPYEITVNSGSCPLATQNRMVLSTGTCGAGPYLPYNLYTTNADTVAFPLTSGTITLGAAPTGGIGTGASQNITIYGAIPAGTTLPTPGVYNDVVTVAANY